MFSHLFIGVTDFDRAHAFYSALMDTLGHAQRFCEREKPWAGWHGEGGQRPLFVIGHPYDGQAHAPGNGQMAAFLATDRATVRAAHRAALAHGGRCEGLPGLRPHYHEHYYGAYFRDPDGNKLSVACHAPAAPRAAVEIVELDPGRLDELVAMWRESFEQGVGVTDPHPVSEQRQYFLDQVMPSHAVRVALLGDELVGLIAASRESVAQLYVRVGYHGLGIGSALLDWARRQSAGSLWLYTFARNHVARGFYESQGFTAIAHGFEPSWQLDDVKYQWRA